MKFEIGQRVAHIDGSIGNVVDDDGCNDEITTDVRWLTPNNEPSVCVSVCLNENLRPVPPSVLPMPRSREWWEEAKQFYEAIEKILHENI